jgi:hypothetical protein
MIQLEQRLVCQNVGRRKRSVAIHNQPGADEHLGDNSGQDGQKIENSGDPGFETWGVLCGGSRHPGIPCFWL